MFRFITNLFKDPKASDEDINLLLLGETGVGKSTLINSISNYFNYPDFEKAKKEKIDILIPVCLNLSDGDKVCGNPDENENHESGKSATQQVKVYLFPIKMGKKVFNLRLVDTPGVGDPRGMEQDNVNLDNILTYLATLKKLHGICFVLKSNQTRFTKFVEYCLKQILTRLDKSASENIIFITTYSKTAQYTAGETKTHCLVPLVKDIKSKPPHVSIPLSDKNIFAVDNEAFKALLEIQEGKTFSKHELKSLAYSWNVSSKEIRRLLTYITGDLRTKALKPHEVENTISVNEVRFLIEQLATPIAEVSELIQDNLRLLDRHKKNLNLENQTVEQLKEQLHIPCVDLEVKELSQPVTVCTDAKCSEIVKVNDVTQWHYRQRCHNPCYLSGIPKEMIGDPGLINCAAMSGENCMRCGCHWKVHMHIYKETEKKEVQKEDQNVKDAIKTKEDARVHIEKLMKDLNQRMKELESEGDTISKIVAKFSFFLQEHALTPFNDAYSDYIKQLIKNEKHLGKFADPEVITKLEKLLTQHELLQKTFQESAKKFQSEAGRSDLTPQTIKNSITELYDLKHMGKTIEQLIAKSTACRHKETQKNFSCIVSQQIDLNKKPVEEQYQKMEYSEYYEDVDAIYEGDETEVYGSEYTYKTVMQRRREKSPGSEYDLDGATSNAYDYYTAYEPAYEVTYKSRTNDSGDDRSLRSSRNDYYSSSRQSSRRRHDEDDISVRSSVRGRQDSDDQRSVRSSRRIYSEDLYGKKGVRSSVHQPDRHRTAHGLTRISSRTSYDWDKNKYSRDPDDRKPVKLHRSESRTKQEIHNYKPRQSSKTEEREHKYEKEGRVRQRHEEKEHRSSRSSRNDNRSGKKDSSRHADREPRYEEHDNSARSRHHRRGSYDSDDHHSKRSSRNDYSSRGKDSKYEENSDIENDYSGSDQSGRSFDSGHNVKKSKNQRDSKYRNKNRDSDGDRPARSSQNVNSVRRSDIRNQKKFKPSDENRDFDEKLFRSSRRGRKGKANDSDSDHSNGSSQSERSVRRSGVKNQKKLKSDDENGDSDDKHSARSSRSGRNAKYTESKDENCKSDDQDFNRSSRKEDRVSHTEKNRKKTKRSDKSHDLVDNYSNKSRSENNKPKNEKIPKSDSKKNAKEYESTKKKYEEDNSSDKSERSAKSNSSVSSDSSEAHLIQSKNLQDNLSSEEEYEHVENEE